VAHALHTDTRQHAQPSHHTHTHKHTHTKAPTHRSCAYTLTSAEPNKTTHTHTHTPPPPLPQPAASAMRAQSIGESVSFGGAGGAMAGVPPMRSVVPLPALSGSGANANAAPDSKATFATLTTIDDSSAGGDSFPSMLPLSSSSGSSGAARHAGTRHTPAFSEQAPPMASMGTAEAAPRGRWVG
jgi:hypothetical protein